MATTLLAIVFVGVYTAFSTSIRLWRLGEANLMVYQDARTSLSMLTHELESVLPRTAYLMEGTADSIEFYAIVPPMDAKKSEGARPLWIRYRLKDGGLGQGDILVREERVVESPLPAAPPKGGNLDLLDIKMGNEHSFELASGVKAFRLAYYSLPAVDKPLPAAGKNGSNDTIQPPKDVAPIVRDSYEKGSSLPKGIKVTLRLLDPNSDEGETEFVTCMTFREPTPVLPMSEPQEEKTE